MARYTGPKSRIARKFGEGIFGADKVLSKKNYPPGQHGNSRKRKTSEYGVQLREKQKAILRSFSSFIDAMLSRGIVLFGKYFIGSENRLTKFTGNLCFRSGISCHFSRFLNFILL